MRGPIRKLFDYQFGPPHGIEEYMITIPINDHAVLQIPDLVLWLIPIILIGLLFRSRAPKRNENDSPKRES